MSGDRNMNAKQQLATAQRQRQMLEQMRAMLAAFAHDFAAGRAVTLDRFATPIKVGDLVLWHPPHDLVYEVRKIDPVLEARMGEPLGQITLTLELTAPVTFLAGQPSMAMVVVGHQESPDHAALETPTGANKDNVVPIQQGPAYDPQAEAEQHTADRLDGEAAAAAAADPGDPPSGEGES